MSINIYDLSFNELSQQLTAWSEPAYRAAQIWEGLYRHLWSKPEEFTTLSKQLRLKLAETYSRSSLEAGETLVTLQSIRQQFSSDRETAKTLFNLTDCRQIEAVSMQYNQRNTICISTQAGCAMGCVFCATGQMGFHRNLSSGEIVEQVLYYGRELLKKGEQVTNVVVMGMGEPFHNFDATLNAIRQLNDPQGYNLGARRFTISTSGLIPGIKRFTEAHTQINLAISLHSATDELRDQLMPINHKYPLDQLFSACLEYVQSTHRRISFEWALIQGVNDTPEQARLLAQKLKMFRIGGSSLCHVNLIPLNPTHRFPGQASTRQTALEFQKVMDSAGIPCSVRLRRGIDIQAGCGQLAEENLSKP